MIYDSFYQHRMGCLVFLFDRLKKRGKIKRKRKQMNSKIKEKSTTDFWFALSAIFAKCVRNWEGGGWLWWWAELDLTYFILSLSSLYKLKFLIHFALLWVMQSPFYWESLVIKNPHFYFTTEDAKNACVCTSHRDTYKYICMALW